MKRLLDNNQILFAILLIFNVTIFVTSVSCKPQQCPNIVFIISDDDNYQNFGFMGSGLAQTPTLDRLAKSGTVFTRAHCPSPLCRPSLASILSGQLPHQHGIYSNYLESGGIGRDTIKLDPKGSLPNKLKAVGYSTFATAKYWEGDPRVMGFTHGSADATIENFREFVRKDQNELWDFIDNEHKDNPMFIWWAPLLPHRPHNPPQEFMDMFKDVEIVIPTYVTTHKEEYVKSMRKFYAMGTWFDSGLAELVERLKSVGEYENTLFVFYIDNGYSFGMPGKSSPTEMGLRTPMFFSWPGNIPEGKRIDGLSYALDIHSTILDYAGIKPDPEVESCSLRPLIQGKTTKTRDILFGAVYPHQAFLHPKAGSIPISPERDVYALYARDKKWKYVLFTQKIGEHNSLYFYMGGRKDIPVAGKGEERLYDLEHDPFETTNLIDQPGNKERATRLRQQLFNWWKETGGKPINGISD